MTGRVVLLRGDARTLPLADASVDLVVTSPPYWQQRAYEDGGRVYEGQIGLEPTPAQYIAALVACTREWVRVLRPGGSLFVNLGDKFSDRAEGPASTRSYRSDRGDVIPQGVNSIAAAPRKSLLLLPERFRVACLDELRLVVRQVKVWSKPNAMPESVRDRCRRTHEDWVHLTVDGRYYSAVDRLRQAHAASTVARTQPHRADTTGTRPATLGMTAQTITRDQSMHPLGALPGSVWSVPTQPLRIPPAVAHAGCCGGRPAPGCGDGVDHFAAFPMAWPARLIAGYCPAGICTACGEGRRPATTVTHDQHERTGNGPKLILRRPNLGWDARAVRTTTITGEVCACPDTSPPTRPAVVLDPFGGTGTVAMVAATMGRVGVSVERSADYGRLAAWRTTDPGELARAALATAPRQGGRAPRRSRRVVTRNRYTPLTLFDLGGAG